MSYEIQVGSYTYSFSDLTEYNAVKSGLENLDDEAKISYLDKLVGENCTKTEDCIVDTSELTDDLDSAETENENIGEDNPYLEYLDGLKEGLKFQKYEEEFQTAYENLLSAYNEINLPDENSSYEELQTAYSELNALYEASWDLYGIVANSKRTAGGFINDLIPGGDTSSQSKLLDDIISLGSNATSEINQISAMIANYSGMTADEIEETKDGEINTTKQGATGDCWLLASVNALSYSETGAQILSDSLEYQDDGTLVHLTGAGDYFISDEEIEKAKEKSSGDADVIALELAIEQVREDRTNGDLILPDAGGNIAKLAISASTLKGGNMSEALAYLTGKTAEQLYGDDMAVLLDEYIENSENYVLCGTIANGTTVEDVASGDEVYLPGSHAYSIKSADEETVTIVNPWNSGNEIVLSREVFLETFNDLTGLDLSDTDSEYYIPEVETKTNDDGTVTKYACDENGNIINEFNCDSDNNLISLCMYEYSSEGKLDTERKYLYTNDGVTCTFVQYNSNGVSYIQEVNRDENWYIISSVYTCYDENGNITQMIESGDTGVHTVYYDEDGNITSEDWQYPTSEN